VYCYIHGRIHRHSHIGIILQYRAGHDHLLFLVIIVIGISVQVHDIILIIVDWKEGFEFSRVERIEIVSMVMLQCYFGDLPDDVAWGCWRSCITRLQDEETCKESEERLYHDISMQ